MSPLSPSVRACLWMGGAILSFSAMAIAVRELLRSMGIFEVLFLRTFVALLIIAAIVLRAGAGKLRTQRFGIHLARNLAHYGGQWCWVFAIGALPLATVFAIEFTMPVWTAILAWLFLKERFTVPRVVMLVLGLAGVLLIVRPGGDNFNLAALAMVVGSLCYASSFIFTKRLTSTDSALAILFWMAVIQTPVSLALALPGWVPPVAADVPWILAVGAGAFTAHYCMTRSMMLVDATVAVPIDFIRLPLIALIGAAFYGEALDPMVFVGAAIIFAGTYYSISREARR